jgi:hypothetical protein
LMTRAFASLPHRVSVAYCTAGDSSLCSATSKIRQRALVSQTVYQWLLISVSQTLRYRRGRCLYRRRMVRPRLKPILGSSRQERSLPQINCFPLNLSREAKAWALGRGERLTAAQSARALAPSRSAWPRHSARRVKLSPSWSVSVRSPPFEAVLSAPLSEEEGHTPIQEQT